MSRLIVKNLPKHLKEQDLAAHFRSQGARVTDAKIMFTGTKSRQFGFVGLKTETEATDAVKYFHNTYLHTSQIDVSVAKEQSDPTLDRPWSKHSKGSSAFMRNAKAKGKEDQAGDKRRSTEQAVSSIEVEKKKQRFREFLNLMGAGDKKGQSWNDNFESFME